MKYLYLLIFLFAYTFWGVGTVHAQATSSATQNTVQLSFPIAELGNCSSASDCKTYCDDPTHLDACVAYAKAKGFYKQTALDSQKEEILQDAKTTLGCDSVSSCQTFCADSSHADICSQFAQKHQLKGGKKQPTATTLAKAQTVLGCNSADTCQAVCAQEQNKAKCASFAKENGLKGGNETVGPGGCTSEATCKTFCQQKSNQPLCAQFARQHESSESGERLPLPSGNPQGSPSGKQGAPSSVQPFQELCREHPEKCMSITPRPQEFENRKPSSSSGSPSPRLPFPSGSQQGKNPPLPSVSPSVKGVATHRSVFQWFVDQWFHLR